jgi:hypothetical protein
MVSAKFLKKETKQLNQFFPLEQTNGFKKFLKKRKRFKQLYLTKQTKTNQQLFFLK